MSIYSDIDIKLTKAQNGDVTKDTEFDAVENSILNILSTLKGERRMLPSFASNIYGMLFEPMDEMTARKIGTEIFHSIQVWDPRITIENVNVNANHDRNQYEVKIVYTVKDLKPEELKEIDYILKQE